MRSLWKATEVDSLIAHYGEAGVSADMAQRIYTSRLLGGDRRLVLHGGGNTSLKTTVTDAYGDSVAVLCVKGSGWDLARIEPDGLPAVRLHPLQRLRARDGLSDEEMVALHRANLLDGAAPNPSVETLLHAFLSATYVDHTHATAVLAATDQADGAERGADIFGDSMAVVPYIMPGFALAKAAADAFDRDPSVVGLILLKHGIFTLGETARESYERMIAKVTDAEAYLKRRTKVAVLALPRPAVPGVAEAASVLRGLTGPAFPESDGRRFILEYRGGESVLTYLAGAEVNRYARAGVVTPDHVIRVKPTPLIVPPARDIDEFKAGAQAALAGFAKNYFDYFSRNNAGRADVKVALDPMPRVILVPGLGLFGLGATARDARIAADIAETAIAVISDAEAVGRFESISESETFEVEYWSLEQAKLGRAKAKPLAGHVTVVTGGASGIGAATVFAFAAEGSEVAILDRDAKGAGAVRDAIGGAALAISCDVTKPAQVRDALDQVSAHFGGLDIVVSTAGGAWQGRIGEVDDAVLRESFELNFFAHQTVAKHAVRRVRLQGTGGVLLFNVSKPAINPGRDFGPYGLPKAATLSLTRQYALDYGNEGIRANAVNADRVRTGLYDGDLLQRRAAARGLSVSEYLSSDNLLQREVTAEDVARAFVALAHADKTTGSVFTVDSGNIAAAPR